MGPECWRRGFEDTLTAATAAVTPIGVKAGVAALVGGLAIVIKGFVDGELHGGDFNKLELLALGGAMGWGPTLGLLFSTQAGEEERRLRMAYQAKLSEASVKAFATEKLQMAVGAVDSRVRSHGAKAPLAFLPPDKLDSDIRAKVDRETQRITGEVIRNDDSWFSSPNKDDVRSDVYSQISLGVWSPILSDSSRARTQLEMSAAARKRRAEAALSMWARQAF